MSKPIAGEWARDGAQIEIKKTRANPRKIKAKRGKIIKSPIEMGHVTKGDISEEYNELYDAVIDPITGEIDLKKLDKAARKRIPKEW